MEADHMITQKQVENTICNLYRDSVIEQLG